LNPNLVNHFPNSASLETNPNLVNHFQNSVSPGNKEKVEQEPI